MTSRRHDALRAFANAIQESGIHSEMDARVNQKRPLVELKNGKVILKQKIVSFEKQSETLQGKITDSSTCVWD